MPYLADYYDSIGLHDTAEWYRTHNVATWFIESFTPKPLYNIDKLRGVPEGTTIKEIENGLYSLNYYNFIRAGIIMLGTPNQKGEIFIKYGDEYYNKGGNGDEGPKEIKHCLY